MVMGTMMVEVTTAEAVMPALAMRVAETEEATDMGAERPSFDHRLRRVPWR